jgi:hypothetical protein
LQIHDTLCDLIQGDNERMSQNPNGPNYNPYGQNPNGPNYPNPSGTGYGDNPQTPPGPNSGMPYPPSNPNMPNSGYGQYDNLYAPPPPVTDQNPYMNQQMPAPPITGPNPYDPYSQTVFNPRQNSGQPVQPYTAYPPSGTPMGLPPQQPFTPQKRRRGPIILIVVIALVIILGGVIAGVTLNTNRQNAIHISATATAQAIAQNTASAQSTVAAQQTVTASTYPFSNKLVLSDPLTDNSKGFNWDNDGQFCFFSGSAYHVFDNQNNTYGTCMANKTSFANFTFESEMLMKQGDDSAAGGLVFRADTSNNNNKFYRLSVDTQGNYGIYIAVDTTGDNTRTLKSGVASSFTTGFDATNTLAVVAKGSQISFYVNQQLVTTITDSTYSQGEIGYEVDESTTKPVEAIFSNAKVWQLPA